MDFLPWCLAFLSVWILVVAQQDSDRKESSGGDLDGPSVAVKKLGSCEESEFGCCADGITAAQDALKHGCPGIFTQCELKRAEALNSNNEQGFVPECLQNGMYAATQCWKVAGICWCADLEGFELSGSRMEYPQKPKCTQREQGDCKYSPYGCCSDQVTSAQGEDFKGCPALKLICESSRFGCCPDGKTPAKGRARQGCPTIPSACNRARATALQNVGSGEGKFIPECLPDGSYARIQCQVSTGFCWCISEFGEELKGTRTRGKPDCDAGKCQDRRSDCADFAGTTDYCKTYQEYMGKYCAKSCNFCREDVLTTPKPYKPKRPGCKSIYGCCEDGLSPAIGPDDEACPVYGSVCLMPAILGPCKANLRRYFFNKNLGRCEKFFYGGCKGNENNFKSMAECETFCYKSLKAFVLQPKGTHAPTNITFRTENVTTYSQVTSQSPQSVATTASPVASAEPARRTTPTSVTRKAQESTVRPKVSTEKVRPTLLSTRESAKPKTEVTARTTGGKPTASPTRFGCGSLYGCCQDGLIPALGPDYLGCPEYTSVCQMPPARGPCRKLSRRYFYNFQLHRCEQFEFGGCGGNGNNFIDLRTCLSTCMKGMPEDKIKAMQETTPATPTTAPLFFDQLSECEKRRTLAVTKTKIVGHFVPPEERIYLPECNADGSFASTQCWSEKGFCWCADRDGNEVGNSRTKGRPRSCPQDKATIDPTCKDSLSQCAEQAAVENYCKDYRTFMRAFCPKSCGYCEKILRPGCGSQYGCCKDGVTPATGVRYQGCPNYTWICDMPKNPGSCRASMPRFFYNKATGRCEKFIYGGCKGNMNNFLTRVECYFRCEQFKPTEIPTTTTITTTSTTTAAPTTTVSTTGKVPSTVVDRTSVASKEKTTEVTLQPKEFSTVLPPLVITDDVGGISVKTKGEKEDGGMETTLPPPVVITDPEEELGGESMKPELSETPNTLPPIMTDIVENRLETLPPQPITPPEGTTRKSPLPTREEQSSSQTENEHSKVTTSAFRPTTDTGATYRSVETTDRVTTFARHWGSTDLPKTPTPVPPLPDYLKNITVGTEVPPLNKTDAPPLPEHLRNITVLNKTRTDSAEPRREQMTSSDVRAEAVTKSRDSFEISNSISRTTKTRSASFSTLALSTEIASSGSLATQASKTGRRPLASSTLERELIVTKSTKTHPDVESTASSYATVSSSAVFESKVTEHTPTEAPPLPYYLRLNLTSSTEIETPGASSTTRKATQTVTPSPSYHHRPSSEARNAAQTAAPSSSYHPSSSSEMRKSVQSIKSSPSYHPSPSSEARKAAQIVASSPRDPTPSSSYHISSSSETIKSTQAIKSSPIYRLRTSSETRKATQIATSSSRDPPSYVSETRKVTPTASPYSSDHPNSSSETRNAAQIVTSSPSYYHSSSSEKRKATQSVTPSSSYHPRFSSSFIGGDKAGTDRSSRLPPSSKSFVQSSQKVSSSPSGDHSPITDQLSQPSASLKSKSSLVLKHINVSALQQDISSPSSAAPRIPKPREAKPSSSIDGANPLLASPVPESSHISHKASVRSTPALQVHFSSSASEKTTDVRSSKADVRVSPSTKTAITHGSEVVDIKPVTEVSVLPDIVTSVIEVTPRPITLKSTKGKCLRHRDLILLKLSENKEGEVSPPPGAYLPSCKDDGNYESTQCWPSVGECWCVDENGMEIPRSRKRGNLDCTQVNLTNCEMARRKAIEKNSALSTKPEEDRDIASLVFVPDCNRDGAYALVQCDRHRGKCWCSTEEGEEIQGTVSLTGKPQCSEKLTSKCEKHRKDAEKLSQIVNGEPIPILGTFIPKCERDGRFSPMQCWEATGLCWCVDKNGNEIKESRTVGRANCNENATRLPLCEQQRRRALETGHIVNGRHLPLLGAFVPHCDKYGEYAPVQCHGSIGFCWCVEKNGNEIPGTRLRGRPDCPNEATSKNCKTVAAKMVEKLESGTLADNEYIPRCQDDGRFSTLQCWGEVTQCWCVDDNGNEINGTRNKGQIDCNQALATTKQTTMKMDNISRTPTPKKTLATTVKPIESQSLCGLPVHPGSCNEPELRWFYDKKTNACQSFEFSGCGGNANNFKTVKGCVQRCILKSKETIPTEKSSTAPKSEKIPTSSPSLCALPKNTGNCSESILRWFYNLEMRACQPFLYTGCGGNQNNFVSAMYCSRTCDPKITSLQPTTNAVIPGDHSTARPTQVPSADYIEITKKGCLLPPQTGPCRGYEERWHYDAAVRQCSKFIYGGCKGNDNNFKTENECLTTCQHKAAPSTEVDVVTKATTLSSKVTKYKCNSRFGCCEDGVTPADGPNYKACPSYESLCAMPPVPGPCNAQITRWFYNMEMKSCTQFVWRGCDGNANNFGTVADCFRVCGNFFPGATSLPAGPSAATANVSTGLLPKGKGDVTGQVEGCNSKFGCCDDKFTPATGPNKKGCPTYDSVCDMPLVKGNCKSRIVRWYYDPSTLRCESFIFSGCGGNKNNFANVDVCSANCEKGQSLCIDRIPDNCPAWQDKGFCATRRTLMTKYCRKSCNFCEL